MIKLTSSGKSAFVFLGDWEKEFSSSPCWNCVPSACLALIVVWLSLLPSVLFMLTLFHRRCTSLQSCRGCVTTQMHTSKGSGCFTVHISTNSRHCGTQAPLSKNHSRNWDCKVAILQKMRHHWHKCTPKTGTGLFTSERPRFRMTLSEKHTSAAEETKEPSNFFCEGGLMVPKGCYNDCQAARCEKNNGY